MDGGKMEVTFSIESLKEPRGFIRVLQFILSIFAFATTTGHSSFISFNVLCGSKGNSTGDITTNVKETFNFHYSYDLEESCIQTPICSTAKTGQFCLLAGAESAAQFYVFVGVIVFLFCLASLGLYIFFDEFYRRNPRVILADFFATCLLAFFWLVGSSAWAQGVSDVKLYTDLNEGGVFDIPDCKGDNGVNICQTVAEGNYASLNVSIIFGFLNFLVWVGNVWFLYKETPFFGGAGEQQNPQPATPGEGPGAGNVY